jgi:predicted PurR-regulated permease PerM
MRMPYAYALGPIAGALEFIPIVGPLIGGATIIAVGFAANYNHLVIVLLFLILWRAVQDYFCSPRILGDKLELPPLAVMFGVLAGGELGGVIGVFVSIPVMATLKIIWRTWRNYNASQAAAGSAVGPVSDAA